MTLTEKYNFKINTNQHKHKVDPYYEDITEKDLLNLFEGCCLNLKKKDKKLYTMIELGSNWAYYSLLFKHILGKDKTHCMMVEPIEESLQVGMDHFKLNDCKGVFYKKGVGTTMEFYGKDLSIEPITLDEILLNNNLNNVDILHCDIDTAELNMLQYNTNFFKNKKAKFVFILTHNTLLEQQCKEMLTAFPYKLLVEYPHATKPQGGDGLLVLKAT